MKPVPVTVMDLVTSWDPYWLEDSHWYWAESSSRAEDRLKDSEEEEAEAVSVL